MDFYLAIDQGGTKTDAVIVASNGEIIGYGNDSDIRYPGEDYMAEQARFLQTASNNALSHAGVTMADISGVCASLNGADWAYDYERLRSMVSETLSIDVKNINVINDCIGAMRGGTMKKDCAVLCVGSGVNCAVRSAEGHEYIYGYFIADDDQGGGALGRAAWKAILDAVNGLGQPTMLTKLVLEKYKKPDVESLFIAFTDKEIPMEPKSLAPIVMKAARLHDAVAMKIIENMGMRLAMYVVRGLEKIGIKERSVELVISGGVTKGDGVVLMDVIEEQICSAAPNVTIVEAMYEPIAGATLIVLDNLYPKGLPKEVSHTFHESTVQYGMTRNIRKGKSICI